MRSSGVEGDGGGDVEEVDAPQLPQHSALLRWLVVVVVAHAKVTAVENAAEEASVSLLTQHICITSGLDSNF